MDGYKMNKRALKTGRAVSQRLIRQGAEGVVLFGSWVRGDAYKESDLDIHAIGKGPRYGLERFEDFLISISWATAKQHRQAFKDPSKAAGVIPGWRSAAIIYDPKGIAKALKKEAQEWRWTALGRKVDAWVAEELTGWAEEVHRLVGNLQRGNRSAASVQRSLLAIHMAPILALHHRILYDTENQLWNLVSARMGLEWARIQSVALGEGGQSFKDTCKAALQLFALAAQEVKHLLNQRQYQVVVHACEIALQPML
jgi:predicted nucleotidyltransferase